MPNIRIRSATKDDAAGVAAAVCEAYAHYIERIGKQPAPMLDDYSKVISEAQVHVAIGASGVVGAIVLRITDDGFYVDNVAVRLVARGSGVGRSLLQLAEAEAVRQGFRSIYLATHELMNENRGMYERAGYVQYDQRVVDGYSRVFLRKMLG